MVTVNLQTQPGRKQKIWQDAIAWHFGPADLSISLGIPGQFDNPLLIQTVDKVIETCKKHGVAPGIQTRGVAMAKFWAERGMRFIGVAAEHVFLLEKCKEAMAALRPAK